MKSRGRISRWDFSVKALGDSENSDDWKRVGEDGVESDRSKVDSEKFVGRLHATVAAIPSVVFTVKRHVSQKFAIGSFVIIAFLLIAVREVLVRKARYNQHGSVADLVKRGQLRSDRRGISKLLKYDDPFNNPLVKVGKGNSTIEMCGKVYRLAQVTLTKEEQSSHQKRRSRAYQWKRPTIFLKEGDPIPPDVDPDTIRWIPANHPFATTVNDIDEDLAQNNVYQTDGVPFRIKAEHEALQRKLEALQREQKLNKVAINPSSIREFERPSKSLSKQQEQLEQSPLSMEHGTTKSDRSFENNVESEELEKPLEGTI